MSRTAAPSEYRSAVAKELQWPHGRSEGVPRAAARRSRPCSAARQARRARGLAPRAWSRAAARPDQARNVDWRDVLQSMRAIAPPMLVAGAALAACSHLLYSGYDLLGRADDRAPARHRHRHGRDLHQLCLQPQPRHAGRRHRLPLPALHEARPGQPGHHAGARLQPPDQLVRLPAAGRRAVLLRPLALPPDWKIDGSGLRVVGVALLLRGASPTSRCAPSPGPRWQSAASRCETPSLRMALLQLDVGRQLVADGRGHLVPAAAPAALHRGAGGVPGRARWPGVVTHIPGGLGVLEGVFVALLGHRAAARTPCSARCSPTARSTTWCRSRSRASSIL